jgi:hypothetical protein
LFIDSIVIPYVDPSSSSQVQTVISSSTTVTSSPQWRTYQWSICSAGCGGGIRLRTVHCILNEIQVLDENCDLKTRPSNAENCNTFSCAEQITSVTSTDTSPAWRTFGWSQCNAACNDGIQTRIVQCVFNNNVYPDSVCNSVSKPANAQICNNGPCATITNNQPVNNNPIPQENPIVTVLNPPATKSGIVANNNPVTVTSTNNNPVPTSTGTNNQSPSIPTLLNVIRSSSAAKAYFQSGSSNGISIDSFRISVSSNGQFLFFAFGSSSPIDVTNLDSTSTYQFTVAARSPAGYWSQQSNMLTVSGKIKKINKNQQQIMHIHIFIYVYIQVVSKQIL